MKDYFEISVKISDQKFNICILENRSVFEFTDIYPKLKQVVKIGANEDIDFQTHDFELYYELGQSKIGFTIKSFNHFIRHQSLIEIKSKPKEVIRGSDERLIPFRTSNRKNPVSDKHNSDLSEKRRVDRNDKRSEFTGKPNLVFNYHGRVPRPFDIVNLIENRKVVANFYQIVLEINIGWNFLSGNPMNVWRKVSDALTYKSIVISAQNCCSIFNAWTHYYALYYDLFEGRISRFSQEVFDLLKVVHTLELRQLLRDTNQTLHRIERISKTDPLKKYFRKHLSHIYQQKLNEKEVEVSQTVVPQSSASNETRISSIDLDSNNPIDCTLKSTTIKRMRDNESPANNNRIVKKKVISFSDYWKSRPKLFTKITENIQTNDSLKSVQRIKIEESDTQMNDNPDPRLREGTLLYQVSLQKV